MIRRPPRSTRTDTLFPYTTLFRSSLREALEADTIILAIPFREHREVAKILPNWDGKTIIDATNVFGVPSEELDGLPSSAFVAKAFKIGRAHVLTPVTNAHPVCRLLLLKKKLYIPFFSFLFR